MTGVRIGNVPDHKNPIKKKETNQSWFPEEWSSDKIKKAGEYVANLSTSKALQNGVTAFGEYDGVRVGVKRTNGEIATVFPDSGKQP